MRTWDNLINDFWRDISQREPVYSAGVFRLVILWLSRLRRFICTRVQEKFQSENHSGDQHKIKRVETVENAGRTEKAESNGREYNMGIGVSTVM